MVTPDKAVELLKPYLFSPCFTKEFQEAYALAVETLEQGWAEGEHSVKWCPYCFVDTMVADARQTWSGLIRRKRTCPKCKKSFKTLEIPMDFAPEAAKRL